MKIIKKKKKKKRETNEVQNTEFKSNLTFLK